MSTIVTDRRKGAVHKHWSGKDKVKAIACYLVSGNMARVAEATGIPLGTLNFWKTQPWWFEQVEKIRSEENQEIDHNFTRIVKKSQEIMMDRLENGDYTLARDGTAVRKPVSVRDAAIVGAIGIDKRETLRNIPRSQQTQIGMSERLKTLEEKFKSLSKREAETIDVTPVRIEDDSEDGEGLSSEVGGREEPLEEGIVQEGGSQEVAASGILQTQGEVING